MPKLAVVGQPIAHSLSPRMQTAALEARGLAGEWSYEAIELAPGEFAAAIERLASGAEGEWAGVNVTIPHKRAALEIADAATDAARAIGAANTLSFHPGPGGDGPRIAADNTDAPAVVDAIRAAGADPAGRRALVLGAGGSARAAVWALVGAGSEVSIWNRTAERAAALAAELGGEAVPAGEPPRPERAELVVNTTAVGHEAGDSSTAAAGFKALGFGVDQLSEQQVVVDLSYGSAGTGLVEAAKGRGARTIDGLEILVRQGARSFEIWTGLEAPIATMERAVYPRHRQR